MAAKGNNKRMVKRKGANGYKLPDPISPGEIVTDLSKQKWVIGKSIGMGGFGEIYSASVYTEKSSRDFSHVIKIEPHNNGPLFVEMHFYMRNAKPQDVDMWMSNHKIQHLGMPTYIGSGSHEYKGTKYRFLVMDRYGKDLWNLFLENDRLFPEETVYQIVLQVLNVLEYIHSRMYVHADIKGANLLIDLKSMKKIYLVDFGLAAKVTQKNEYKVDPKKAHNGTIEYTSRDAHMGIPTMRGDLEILGYNIVQWLSGELPWEKNSKDVKYVQAAKERAINDVDKFLQNSFSRVPTPISQYFHLLHDLEFNDTPNYSKINLIFEKALNKLGHRVGSDFTFGSSTSSSSSTIPSTSTAALSTPKTDAKRLKQLTAPRRASPRLQGKTSPKRPHVNLDESTVGVVLDKKREKLRDIKKKLEAIDDDSETEYDIMIMKKNKKGKNQGVNGTDANDLLPGISRARKIKTVVVDGASIIPGIRTTTAQKGRKKIVHHSDSDNEKTTKILRPRRVALKKKPAPPVTDSDEDMFE